MSTFDETRLTAEDLYAALEHHARDRYPDEYAQAEAVALELSRVSAARHIDGVAGGRGELAWVALGRKQAEGK
jgi:hypothetical protein